MANVYEQFDDTSKSNVYAQFDDKPDEITAPPPSSPVKTSFLQDVVSNFKGGLGNATQAVKDVAQSNYIGSGKPSPNTEALADKLFPKGYGTGTNFSENFGDFLNNALKNTKPGDYSKAILEKSGQTVPGEIASAIGGIVPEFNAAGTLINRNVNPKISSVTGIAPENLQFLETAASPLGFKAAGKATLPVSSAIKNAVLSPIETAKNLPKNIASAAKSTADILTPEAKAPLKKGAEHAVSGAEKVYNFGKDKIVKPVVQKTAGAALNSDLPLVGGGVKKALESETAREGERLGKKLGVNFSAGELTGNNAARGVEDYLANDARWSSKFTEANETKINSIVGKFKEMLDKISPQSSSRSGLGETMTAAYKKTIDSLVATRRGQAATDFARAEQATGGKPIIQPTNFIKVLTDFIKEGDSPTATPAQRAATAQAKGMLASLSEKPPKQAYKSLTGPRDAYSGDGAAVPQVRATPKFKNITVRDLQNGLAAYGEGAKVNGGIWKSLDTASDRRFSTAAKNALQADLDAAAESGQGEGAAALKIARDNYRRTSAQIGDIQQTTLGKVIGGAKRDSEGHLVVEPEKIADKFSSMNPTELKNTLSFLDKNHPDVAAQARRYTLEAAYRKAVDATGQRGAGTTKNFGKADFVKNLPSDDKLEALLGDKKSVSDVKDVAAAVNRLIDYGASRKGSDTAIRGTFDKILQFGYHQIGKALIGDTLAEDLLNPQLRKQMAAEAKKGTKPTPSTNATNQPFNNFLKANP